MLKSSKTTVGVLASLAGIKQMKDAGQHERLLNYDLTYYARAFDQVIYFSYLSERLEDYTNDPLLLSKVRLVPKPQWIPRRLYMALMPLVQYRAFHECAILRVFQLTGVIPAVIAKWLYKIPYVTTFGYDYAEFERLSGRPIKSLIYKLFEQIGLPQANGVLVTVEDIRANLAARFPNTPLCLAPNGVDTHVFKPLTTSRDPNTFNILFVGRMEIQKNLERFITAISRLKNAKAVTLSIVGEGSLKEGLAKLSQSLGVRVRFEGVLDHSQLPHRMGNSDVFALPSLKEGHAKALLEAMACGLPCAVSRGSGSSEIVEAAGCGIAFDPYSIDDITQGLEQMIGQPLKLDQWSQAARKWACDHFDIGQLMDKETTFLKSCAGLAKD